MHFSCACRKWISEKHDRYEHGCISILAWHGKYDYPICISEMHAQNAFARCMPDIHIGFVYQITYWLLISDRHIRSQTHMPIKDMLEAGLAGPARRKWIRRRSLGVSEPLATIPSGFLRFNRVHVLNGLRSEEGPGVREPLGKQYLVGIASGGVRVD